MTRMKLALLVPIFLVLAGCTANQYLVLTDAIVSSAEIAIAAIPNVPPAVNTYLNGGLTITDNLITCGTTPACIATAVTAFSALVVPNVTNPQMANLIAAFTKAIANFISVYSGAPSAMRMGNKPPPKINLSESDRGHLLDMHVRIVAAKAKLTVKK